MFNKTNRRAGRGFTITEILIAVLLVLILSAIAVPRLLGNQRQADDTAAKAQLRTAAEVARNLMYEAGGDFRTADVATMTADEPNIEFAASNASIIPAGNRRPVSIGSRDSNKEWVAAVVGGDNQGQVNCWFIKLDNGAGSAKGADWFSVALTTEAGCNAAAAPGTTNTGATLGGAAGAGKWEKFDFPARP
jgi:prepilin-type N-terminal cleavage/methylation domain-containing protein